MKTSLKRKSQIRLLADHRKNDKLVKKKSKVIVKPKQDSWIRVHMKNLILRQPIDYKCPHLHVGSSCFLRFLRGQFNYRKAHGFLFSQYTHGIGLAGEQAFAASHDNFVYHPFSVSKRLPFLCSTPDFILKEKKVMLVEIKTCTTLKKCQELFNSPPLEYLFQIWVSLEIFGLDEACLMIYFFDEYQSKRNRYGTTKAVSLFAKINLKVKTKSLMDRISELAIQRFVDYANMFFKGFGEEVTLENLKEVKETLVECFKKHKRLSTSNYNVNSIIQKKNLGIVTRDCYRMVNLDPDELKGGTVSREKHDKEYYKNLKNCLERRRIKFEKKNLITKTMDFDDAMIDSALKIKKFLFKN